MATNSTLDEKVITLTPNRVIFIDEEKSLRDYLRSKCLGFAYYQLPPLFRQEGDKELQNYPFSVSGTQVRMVTDTTTRNISLELRGSLSEEDKQAIVDIFSYFS
ncbi:MAG: hypothetical protein AABX04_04370 [Nanoarchaeota archaeon]